jgi:hypothetical protein
MTRKAILLIFFCVFYVMETHGLLQKEWKGTIEYENGVKVIKNPSEPLYGEIVFDLEENLSIGSPNDENSTFYSSVFIAVDSDGNILALDTENCRIQKFSEKGDFLYTIGRKGQGPGEFVRPSELILDMNDNVHVRESRKLHKFKKTGEYIESISLGSLYRSIGITKEGHILAMAQISSPTELSDDVCLLAPDGNKIKTIASYSKPRPDYSLKINLTGSSIQPRLNLCPLSAENAVYSHSSSYRLYIVNSSGELSLIFEKDEPPIPFTQKEKNQQIDEMLERLNKGGQQFSRREIEKAFNFPKMKPIFSSLQNDDEQNIYVWILRSYAVDQDDKFPYFDFFNKDGYYLYRVKTRPLPKIIKNGHLYCDERDKEGYVYIKRYKIKNWDQMKKAAK